MTAPRTAAKCPNFLPHDHHPYLSDPAEHEDDSYGGCVICMFTVPHTDDEMERAPFPCAVVREAEAAPSGLDVERRYRKIIARLGDLIWDLGWGDYSKRSESIARFSLLLSMAREQVDGGQTDQHGHYQYHSPEEVARLRAERETS